MSQTKYQMGLPEKVGKMFISTMYDTASSLKISEGINKIKEMGENSVVLMDSNFSALPEFYKACKKAEMKPIIGVSLEVDGVKVSVVCKNEKGYKYIAEKVSGPMRMEDLKHDDIDIILTGFSNQINADWLLSEMPEAYVGAFEDSDPDRMQQMGYLWGQRDEDRRLPYFVPNHNNEEDKETLRALRAVKGNGVKKGSIRLKEIPKDIDRGRHIKNFFATPTPDGSTMAESFPYLVENYTALHSQCVDDYSFGNPKAPSYPFVKESIEEAMENGVEGLREDSNENELFTAISEHGLGKRLEKVDSANHQEYKERLSYEIEVIKKMGFPGYMLIVWDLITQAKKLNVPVGPGRGSAAGSLVAFSMGITNIDPMPYGLLFERFLNPDRVSMPDIDIDVSQSNRKMVLELIRSRYGAEHVAQIPAFGMIRAKNALKDAVRILDYEKIVGEKLAELIPMEGETPATLGEAYERNPDEIDKTIAEYKADEVWTLAKKLENNPRNLSVNAAGVVISSEPIAKKAPLMYINGVKTIQFEGAHTEFVDLIKFDLLGLKTLSVIDNALSLIEGRTGEKIDMGMLPLNDSGVYEYISQRKLDGIFQLDSDGMQDLCKKLKPSTFEDVISILALYRPGVLGSDMLDSFIQRKNGKEPITYFSEEFEGVLKPILGATYGIMVYQEQVMKIVQEVGGFTLGQADIIRRSMGKKDPRGLAELANTFADGAATKGYVRDNAVKLFHMIQEFAGYGFNKSHSAAYAMITYQTAWLKMSYPIEYTAALLNFVDDDEKLQKYVHDAIRNGVKITPPDINRSDADFIPNKAGEIPLALSSIKEVGKAAALFISNERKGIKTKDFEENLFSIKEEKNVSVDYESFDDFMSRINNDKINKGAIKALISAGAFDKLEKSRKELFRKIGQEVPDGEGDFSIAEKIKQEEKSLGFILTDPFKNARHIMDEYVIPEFNDIPTSTGNTAIPTFMITLPIGIEKKLNKKGNTFLSVELLYNHQIIRTFIHDEKSIEQFSKMAGVSKEGEWNKNPVIIGLTKTLGADNSSVWINVGKVGKVGEQIPAVFRVTEGTLKQLFKKKEPPIKSSINLDAELPSSSTGKYP